MSRRDRLAAAVLAAALAGGAGAQPAAEAPLARPLVVPRAGSVRIALPASQYAPSLGFEVLGPDGGKLPVRLLALDAGGAPRRARVVAVTQTPQGWSVIVDAGPSSPPHQGLRLPLAAGGLAEVELAASNDRSAWTPLASATLFRLGAGEELQGSALAYPATDARYLRLSWPAAAKFPHLREVELDSVATAAEEVALPAKSCVADGARRTTCDFASALDALGDRAVESLQLVLPAGRAIGWRLRAATDGRWQMLGEGSWAPLATALPRRLPAGGSGATLRLELWGETDAPAPSELSARVLPLALAFDVPAAGNYELRSAPGLPRPPAEAAAANDDAQWIVPGEARQLAEALPPLAVPAGGALPRVAFARHWPVRTQAHPGDAVRLTLPGVVEAAARSDLADLRLAREGRQVPYLVDEVAVPERAAAWDRVVPRPRGQGTSVAELPLPAGLGRLEGELLLRVPPRPLQRDVRLVRQGVTDGVGDAPELATPWREWRCEPLPPLPCELALPALSGGRGPLRLEIADGDNAPLAEIAAELWQPRRALLFPWPGGPVALLAGSPRVGAPSYELAAVAAELRARPARSARLGPAAEGWEGAPARWPRWAVLASLGLAAAVLLLLLARALPRMPESQPPPRS
ncbi:MAG TPA: DUF3999 family protein [Thermoanaerobaculia bacterium]|jgi:hypothetical protein|nr:DUF3999 family protein [Thermoanaerobaculia bacterium]